VEVGGNDLLLPSVASLPTVDPYGYVMNKTGHGSKYAENAFENLLFCKV
jgi:hypothetical protein